MSAPKHYEEMPDEILLSLGFVKTTNLGVDCWSHTRLPERRYYHILTPNQVTCALIEIGHTEFRRRARQSIEELEIES